MILEKGDMWSVFGKTDAFMITTNPIIRNDGAVVMGRGIALQVKERFPNLPYDFGEALQEIPPFERTNVGYIATYQNQPIWWFMVKNHWREPASINIIRESCFQLEYGFGWENRRIDLNFPGIGNGRLDRESVLAVVKNLPDNVHIWEYE